MPAGVPVSIDLRSRVDGQEPPVAAATFLDEQLPSLFASSAHLLASAAHLDLRPLAVVIGDESWVLERSGGVPTVRRAPADGVKAVWTVEPATFADVVADLLTPIALMTSDALLLDGAGIGRLLDWWLVLRCVLDQRPVHVPGDDPGEPHEHRSFTLDDDPAEVLGFLSTWGYLHLRGVFTEAEMARVSSEMDDAAASYADGDGNSWWVTLDDGRRSLVRMQRFDERSPATAALLEDDRLAAVRDLPGLGHTNRWAHGNRIEALFKPIGVETGISDVPWHKDCSLGRHSYECCSLTVGVSVTGAGPGTGQLHVVAGSHRALVWPSLLDPVTTGMPIVALPTDTGDLTVHLSCMLHMAEPPTAAERRVLYTGYKLPALAPEAADANREKTARARELAPLITSQQPTRP